MPKNTDHFYRFKKALNGLGRWIISSRNISILRPTFCKILQNKGFCPVFFKSQGKCGPCFLRTFPQLFEINRTFWNLWPKMHTKCVVRAFLGDRSRSKYWSWIKIWPRSDHKLWSILIILPGTSGILRSHYNYDHNLI